MKKKLTIIVITLIVVAGGIILGFFMTKKNSPEATVDFESGNLKVSVYYNRPYKKGRQIFGKLVPFGKTWRTGANETTTFTTNQDLTIGGSLLKAGKYSLWTVPNQDSWKVIFNSEIPAWGISPGSGDAAQDAKYDVLLVQVPVSVLSSVVEQFTISIEKIGENNLELIFTWDITKVVVPIDINAQ